MTSIIFNIIRLYRTLCWAYSLAKRQGERSCFKYVYIGMYNVVRCSVSNQLPLKFCPWPICCKGPPVFMTICPCYSTGVIEREIGGCYILKLHFTCQHQHWSLGSSRTSYRSGDQLPPACTFCMQIMASIINPAYFPHPRYYTIGCHNPECNRHSRNTQGSLFSVVRYKNVCTTIQKV